MALRQFYNEIKGMKVKDLPNHLKPMFSLDYVKKSIQRGLDNYNEKYIQTGSVDPLLHVCFGGMIFSYLVALPEERRHLEHQQHAKEHGDVRFLMRDQCPIVSVVAHNLVTAFNETNSTGIDLLGRMFLE
ncbi:hypothetical protein SAY87_008674 [Trapa incisa]|uniref:Fiber protein Fb15 n=1 Tax=Trapa incisa TaxID=236973 RepID=A0AAN7JXJ2_9MYRT|nr:hypothetical protein SAY87_008674 [Trapa incisa]